MCTHKPEYKCIYEVQLFKFTRYCHLGIINKKCWTTLLDCYKDNKNNGLSLHLQGTFWKGHFPCILCNS